MFRFFFFFFFWMLNILSWERHFKIFLLIYIYIYIYIYIVTWSTTARREIRNFPYPSMFELTGRQRLTVKKRNRSVGQFLAAEVTNPGQNESQQMFAFFDRMDKEGGIRTYSSPNESPDRGKRLNDWPES